MPEAKFVYVIYISSTADKVWNALFDTELTKLYWEHDNISDWKPGSRWEHRRSDASKKVELAGNVVEFSPPKKLVMTWARVENYEDERQHSRVTIELETIQDMVKLTLVHDKLEPESSMLNGISVGWPRVLSSLKSMLETGKPLDTWAGDE